MPKELALKIYQHIKDTDGVVSQEYIIDRATKKGTPMKVILSALAILHKMKTVQVLNKKSGVSYTMCVAPPKPQMSEEERAYRQQFNEWNERTDKEYEERCARHTPEHLAYLESIFEGIGDCVWIGDSLVPAINEEYFRKVLRSTPRGTRQVSLHKPKRQQHIWQ